MDQWVKELNIMGPTGATGATGPAGPPTYVTMQPDPPAAPIDGQFWYDTDGGVLYFWNGSAWIQSAGLSDAPSDGKLYGRQSAAWIEAVTKAIYDAAWAAQDTRDDGQDTQLSNLASQISSITWTTLPGKPATFPPTLPIPSSGVTGLDAGQAAQDTQIALKVAKAGDTMSGPLVLPADPTAAMQAATKQYVDTKVAAVPPGGATLSGTAPSSPFTGQLWWDTTQKTLRIWTGSAWETVYATWA